jgi:hypothetical protein
MKKLILLLSAMMLLSLNACADNHATKLKTTQGNKMDTHTFGDKPIYKIRVEGTGSPAIILINGVNVYESFTGEHFFSLVTVNEYITSGDNVIMIKLLDEPKLSKDAKVTLTLEVTSSKTKKHYVLATLSYDLSKKNPSEDSSKSGFYRFDDDKGMVQNAQGKLIIGKIKTLPFSFYQRDPVEGFSVTQTVSIPTPYKRWRFLDSEDIIDKTYDYLSKEEHTKLKNSLKIKALYALDAKLRQAFREKNPQKIIDLFDERFEENGAAFYETPQHMKKILLDDFIEVINNPNKSLIEYKGDDLYFVIEENCKLAWIKPIEIFDKETGIYSRYGVKYRLNKRGEWVITR